MEFALILPLMVVLLAGTFEVIMYRSARADATEAVNVGAKLVEANWGATNMADVVRVELEQLSEGLSDVVIFLADEDGTVNGTGTAPLSCGADPNDVCVHLQRQSGDVWTTVTDLMPVEIQDPCQEALVGVTLRSEHNAATIDSLAPVIEKTRVSLRPRSHECSLASGKVIFATGKGLASAAPLTIPRVATRIPFEWTTDRNNTTVSETTFRSPATANYDLSAAITVTHAGAGQVWGGIYVNGTAVAEETLNFSGASGTHTFDLFSESELSVDDLVTVEVFASSGSVQVELTAETFVNISGVV